MKSIAYLFTLALAVTAAACGKSGSTDTKSAPTATTAGDSSRVAITVTEKGFEPEKIAVKKGVATTLVFTRTTDATCAKAVVIPVGGQKVTKDLPLNQPVEIPVTFAQSGDIQYACGMDMDHGVITVQ